MLRDYSMPRTLDHHDLQLIAALQKGLPRVSRPYQTLGEWLGCSEEEVIERIHKLQKQGIIKRLGVIVRHRKVGYEANAMVVWDIPDLLVKELGERLSQLDFVTLCYRRPRHGEAWPYNLFCMIHGQDRGTVEAQITEANRSCELSVYPSAVLFSRRCFKQRGARYALNQDTES